MKDAIKNFLIITGGTLLVAFLVWNYLRGKGYSEPIKEPLDHPFLHQTFPRTIVLPGDVSSDALASYPAETTLWLEIHPDSKGELYVGTPDPTKSPTLEEVLKKTVPRFLVLNFHENRPQMMEKIIAIIDATGASGRLLIQSPEEGLLKDLREKEPLWLFGTSQAQSTRMKMLSSIGLQAMAPERGDVYVEFWSDDRAKAQGISDREIAEAHRRKTKVIAGPVFSGEEQELFNRGVDAVVISPTRR